MFSYNQRGSYFGTPIQLRGAALSRCIVYVYMLSLESIIKKYINYFIYYIKYYMYKLFIVYINYYISIRNYINFLHFPPPLFAYTPRKSRPNKVVVAHRNLFEILLNQPEIRLYLPFSD